MNLGYLFFSKSALSIKQLNIDGYRTNKKKLPKF